MRKFLLSTLFLVIGLTTTVQADDFNMPMSYGSHADKMVSTVFNFYDSGGATGNAEAAEMDWDTYEVNNVYSGVNFVASTAGQQITLSFNTVKIVRGDYIKIYDRALTEEEKTMEFKAPTEEATWTITDSSTPITVTSTSGTLGVLYFEKQTSSDNNWEATVKAFTPAPMQYTSATVDQEGLTTTLLGKENQPLLRINVVTTGSLSPLNLTALAYDLTGTTSLSDLSQLKLYYTGNNDTFSSNQLVEEKTTFTTTGTFTTTQTLTGGNNYFWIAGNIKSTAEGNHTIDVSCPSLQINAENKTLSTPSPTGNITIENVAVMSTTPKTYSVGADGIQLYDDGGATGKISSDFEGSVTFKPSTAGKKVQITFTKLALFNTSSTGLNDVLKVFYGSEAEESQLAATLLKEVCTIQSIAADGALTITLKSTTGIPKDGFEASVSEFTPQAMAFVNSVVTHPTTASVSSSAIDAQLLCVNLKTTGTEPALTLNALGLNVPCFANLSNVKAYYTGNSSTFSIENKLVEQPNPTTATLNLSTNTTLGAGDNYIWITYDVKAAQESGTLLDCSILSATLSEHKTTITNGDPEGARELKNIWVSQLGTNSCTVSGNWLFTHSPSTITAYVDSKYDAVSGDQIVTFKPATAGNVIELKFSDFEIQYASSSYYGTRAKFEIHNGAADGQLLWSVDDTQKATTGPEGIIRSTATDGSLTVIFDAKTTSSYYCLAGWHADVREYQPSNMTLESYTAFQENTNIIMIGAKKQEIMGVEVTMTGTLNPVKATTLTFNTKGSTAQLQGASLYFTGSSKVFSNATTDSITHISTINDESTLTFDQKGVTLAEGKNYFWLTYDLKEGGDADQTIDAALVDMTIAGTKDTAPVVANPKGERLTKNIAQLQPGDNGVKTVTGSLKFYDQNGPDADYVRGVESSITFKPSTPGNVIQLVINQLKLGYSDILSIYDGATVKESADFQQKGSLSDEKTPMTLLSHAEDGSITVYFKSASTTSTYTYEGWDIDVIDYAPQALSLGEITTTTLSSAEIMKGMDDVQMLKMAVNVEGDLGAFTFNNFTFSTEGSTPNSIRKAHLYYTATTDAFSNVN
ncbi:MAG: BNR-repeat neuraminidase N-terminal domain-containing protein, partial [Bacteroidaceae bacterium]